MRLITQVVEHLADEVGDVTGPWDRMDDLSDAEAMPLHPGGLPRWRSAVCGALSEAKAGSPDNIRQLYSSLCAPGEGRAARLSGDAVGNVV